MTNEQRSMQEVADFLAEPPGPYFAYHNAKQSGFDPVRRLHRGDHIQTWMSDQLATVKGCNDPYRSNMGDVRQNFRALGINGQLYSGTAFLSAGDYVRMRPVKS